MSSVLVLLVPVLVLLLAAVAAVEAVLTPSPSPSTSTSVEMKWDQLYSQLDRHCRHNLTREDFFLRMHTLHHRYQEEGEEGGSRSHPRLRPSYQQCTAEDYRYGQWIPDATKQCGLMSKYFHALHDPLQRAPRHSDAGNWCWRPYQCQVQAFNITRFCEKLAGRRMLLVGDSIQHQFYVALFKQLNLRGSPIEQWYVNPLDKEDASGKICVGLGGGRLEYIRNDQMSVGRALTTRWNAIHLERPVTNRDWAAIAHNFDILVLNKGAHYLEESISTNMTVETAHFLQSFLQQHPGRRHVFYRTTAQGAPHCSARSQVNTTLLLTEPYWMNGLRDDSPDDIKKYVFDYNWDKFPHMNRATTSIMTSMLPKEQFTVLHVAEMTALRPDGHRCSSNSEKDDCDELHFYLPSVVDNWVYVFYNLLKPLPSATSLLEETNRNASSAFFRY